MAPEYTNITKISINNTLTDSLIKIASVNVNCLQLGCLTNEGNYLDGLLYA